MKAWLLALGLTHFCIVCAVTEWSKFTPYTYTGTFRILTIAANLPEILQQGQNLTVLPCTVTQIGDDLIIVDVNTPTPNGCVKKTKIFRLADNGNYYCITPGSEFTDSAMLENSILAFLIKTENDKGETDKLLGFFGHNRALTPTLREEIINYAKEIGFMESEIIFEPKEDTECPVSKDLPVGNPVTMP